MALQLGRVVASSYTTTTKSTKNTTMSIIKPTNNKEQKLVFNNSLNVFAEKLNGRLAMIGFVSGSGCESITGLNYIEQAQEHWPWVVGLSTILGYASLKTQHIDVIDTKPFTKSQEFLNGRLAMLGLLCKIGYDIHGFM